MIADLAGRFADEHPVVNTIMIVVIVLTISTLVVFARPIGRAIHRLEMPVERGRRPS